MNKILFFLLFFTLNAFASEKTGVATITTEAFVQKLVSHNAPNVIKAFESAKTDTIFDLATNEDKYLYQLFQNHLKSINLKLTYDTNINQFIVSVGKERVFLSVHSISPLTFSINQQLVEIKPVNSFAEFFKQVEKMKFVTHHESQFQIIEEAHAAILLAIPGLVVFGGLMYTIWTHNFHPDHYSDSQKFKENMTNLHNKCQEDLTALDVTSSPSSATEEAIVAAFELQRISEKIQSNLQDSRASRPKNCHEITRQMTSMSSIFIELGEGKMIDGTYQDNIKSACDELQKFLNCMDRVHSRAVSKGHRVDDGRFRYKGRLWGTNTNEEYESFIDFYRQNANSAGR